MSTWYDWYGSDCYCKWKWIVKKTKEIKIIPESEVNYTFVDTGLIERNQEPEDNIDKKNSSAEKDIIKTRSIDSKKSKIRYKNRIAGGQNQQGHSSVYEWFSIWFAENNAFYNELCSLLYAFFNHIGVIIVVTATIMITVV